MKVWQGRGRNLARGALEVEISNLKRETPLVCDGGHGVNPFAEEHGGRRPLLDTVLELIGSKTLGEAIIVQGIAGASADILRRTVEGLREGQEADGRRQLGQEVS